MVEEEQRTWLTYVEAGQALGMQPNSAKRLSFRRHWPRRMGNDGHARVGVPTAELHDATRGAIDGAPGGIAGVALGDATGDKVETSGGRHPIPVEVSSLEVVHLRVQLAAREGELAGMREALRVAETNAREATQRADRADQVALDAWRTTADLARFLTQTEVPKVPVQTSAPHRGWLGRWFRRSGGG